MMIVGDYPRRAYHIEIVAGGDSLEDLMAALNDILGEIHSTERQRINCQMGGPSLSYHYEFKVDPGMTHEKYFQAVNNWRQETSHSLQQT